MVGRPRGRDPLVPKAGSGLDEEGRWLPEFPGQREPFRVGNVVRETHGAYLAPEKLGERVHEIAAAIRPFVPVYSPAFEPLIMGYALALTRVERAAVALDEAEQGDFERHDSLARHTRSWLTSALRYADALGLSPSSAARIARDAGLATQAVAAHAELLEKYRGVA